MKISAKELRSLNACEMGYDRYLQQVGNSECEVDASTLVGGLNTYSDLLWLAQKKINSDRIFRFTKDCALINIELIKSYTDKYDLIVDFLKSDRKSTGDIIEAACSASCAAYYSTKIDASAACYAADAAICAANFRIFSATNAACSAAGINNKAVDKLLIEMFNEVD